MYVYVYSAYTHIFFLYISKSQLAVKGEQFQERVKLNVTIWSTNSLGTVNHINLSEY